MTTDTVNRADDLLEALTHGPTPSVMAWEIVESYQGPCDNQAWAVLEVDGRKFTVVIEEHL